MSERGQLKLTIFVVVTHLVVVVVGGLVRSNGGFADVGGAFGADAAGRPGVYGVFVDLGGGLVLNGAVMAFVDGGGRIVRGLDAAAVLAFDNVNSAGVVVVVVLVYFDTGLGEFGARGSGRVLMLEVDGEMGGLNG